MINAASVQSTPPPGEINNYSNLIRNIIFILTAGVSFALWLSSTITMPKRLDKLEQTVGQLTTSQSKIEAQTALIYNDLREVKSVLLRADISAREDK